MADRIRFSVSISPIETLTDENSGTHDVVASEVGRTLAGKGDSNSLADYSQTKEDQGYKDAAPNYLSCTHSAGGTELTGLDTPDFVFIKNTGRKYSSGTVLGTTTTDCVLVVIREQAASVGESGGFVDASGNGRIQYYEVGWLQPGQAMVIPCGAVAKTINQFGATSGDLSPVNYVSAPSVTVPRIYVRTYQSDGSAASSANAVEFLAVT